MKFLDTFGSSIQTPVKTIRLFTVLLCVLACQHSIHAQTLKADYQFQGNLNSSVAGAPAMTNLTGSGGANSFAADTVDGYARQSLRFPMNSGAAVNTSGVIPGNAYTVVILFRFDQLTGFRRVMDATDGAVDQCGAYIFNSRFEFESTNNPILFPNLYLQATIVREASGRVRAYRDGYLRVDVANDGGCFQISNNLLRFFQDDNQEPNEASSGSVARIRLFDAPMTTAQVQGLDRVPNAAGGGEQSLLFTSGRDGNAEIYTMNTSGSNQFRLTNTPTGANTSLDITPNWSPNGQKIAFASLRDGNYEIYMMNPDGSGQTRITNNPLTDYYPQFSPDGSKILFSRCEITGQGVCDVWVMNADGANQPMNLTNNPADDDYGRWSPDGTQIVFGTWRDNGTTHEIYTMNANGGNPVRLTNNTVREIHPAWSPDGTKIAFLSERDGNGEIYVMNVNGTNQTNLTNNPFYDDLPIWSPDGTKIAFSSFRETSTGQFGAFNEVFVMNADGTSPVRITFNNLYDEIFGWRGQGVVARRTLFDFDGDGKADVSVFRPDNGTWYIQQSTAGFTGLAFGLSTDKLVPADYDGDGKTDIAVFRGGTWYLQRSLLGFTGVAFGASDDIPVPADYDGDGKADIAVFRPSNGTWYIQRSTLGFIGIIFGQNGDKPVPADYDGDGKADLAVNRSGVWYLNRTTTGFTAIAFGDGNDKLVPADYDGDGKADVAVFRPSNGTWYLNRSQTGFTGIAFGVGTDAPVAADYDGDGKADVSVFRDGIWYLNRTTGGFTGVAFGAATDKPIPNAFVR